MLATNPYILAIIGISLGVAMLPPISDTAPRRARPEVAASQSPGLETLANDNYQFCSQPDPEDGRDGAGVCFNFAKRGDRVDGYYGYPHSGTYVCIRGRTEQDRIVGHGLVLSWPGHPWPAVVPSQYTWRLDSHLILQNGYIIRSLKEKQGPVDWIQFDDVKLDIGGFYQYPTVKMRSPSQLCEWETP